MCVPWVGEIPNTPGIGLTVKRRKSLKQNRDFSFGIFQLRQHWGHWQFSTNFQQRVKALMHLTTEDTYLLWCRDTLIIAFEVGQEVKLGKWFKLQRFILFQMKTVSPLHIVEILIPSYPANFDRSFLTKHCTPSLNLWGDLYCWSRAVACLPFLPLCYIVLLLLGILQNIYEGTLKIAKHQIRTRHTSYYCDAFLCLDP